MKLLTQTEKSAEKRLPPLIGAELLFDSLDFAYDFGKITDPQLPRLVGLFSLTILST